MIGIIKKKIIEEFIIKLENEPDSAVNMLDKLVLTIDTKDFLIIIKKVIERDELKCKITRCGLIFKVMNDYPKDDKFELLKIFLKDEFLREQFINEKNMYIFIREYIPLLLIEDECIKIMINNKIMKKWTFDWVYSFMNTFPLMCTFDNFKAFSIVLKKKDEFDLETDTRIETLLINFELWSRLFLDILEELDNEEKSLEKKVKEIKLFDDDEAIDLGCKIIKFKIRKDFFCKEFLNIVSQSKEDLKIQRLVLLDNENIVGKSTYKLIGVGYYCGVIRYGNSVVKFGKRYVFEIPYHKRIIIPTFRKLFESRQIVLEIMPLGESEISDEKITEMIFYEMKDDGIRWTDARKDNIVKLDVNLIRKPPFIKEGSHWKGLVGFKEDGDSNVERPEADEDGKAFMICDHDYVYNEDDPNKAKGNMQSGLEDR